MSIMNSPIIAAMPSGTDLIIIFAVILLLFGGSKLPALARGLGQSVKEFKKASQSDEEDKTKAAEAKKAEPGKTSGSN
jgi:sec-independent protein translocase protein TatA